MPRRSRLAFRRPCTWLGLIVPMLMLLPAPGCAAGKIRQKHQERKIPQYGTYDPGQPRELDKTTLPAYVIEPPDELEVSARPASLDLPISSVVVRQDGVIDLGFAGEVLVTGLTIPEAELKIAQHLAAYAAEKGVSEPIQVAVRLINGSRSKQYYVLGTVNSPGPYPITGNDTVLDAIIRAGLRSNSLPDKAFLARPRPAGAGEQQLRIDWERIRMGDTMTNYQLMPGDRIVVPGGPEPGLLRTFLGG